MLARFVVVLRSAICGRGPTCGAKEAATCIAKSPYVTRAGTAAYLNRATVLLHRLTATTAGTMHSPRYGANLATDESSVRFLVDTGLVQATERYSGSACHHAKVLSWLLVTPHGTQHSERLVLRSGKATHSSYIAPLSGKS